MKDLDWTHKGDHLEKISPVRFMTWATHPWRHKEQRNLVLDPLMNTACYIMFAVWSWFKKVFRSLLIAACYYQIKEGQPRRKRLSKAAGSFWTNTVNVMHWNGKTLLADCCKYILGNCGDRQQKKSFLFLLPFPHKCKSWEGLVFLGRTQPVTTTSVKLVKGCRRRVTASSPARRDGTHLNKHGTVPTSCHVSYCY